MKRFLFSVYILLSVSLLSTDVVPAADTNAPVSPNKTATPTTQSREEQLKRMQQRRERYRQQARQWRKRAEQIKQLRETTRQKRAKMQKLTPQQQLQIFEQKIKQEKEKHLLRIAKLNRIRELALEENRSDIVGRVDRLVKKEQARYSHKQQQMQRRKRALERLGARARNTRMQRTQLLEKERARKRFRRPTEGANNPGRIGAKTP